MQEGRKMKRDNFKVNEIIGILEGLRLEGRNDFIEFHNGGINSAIDTFYDFTRPENESGAMAFMEETGEIVHIGEKLAR